jgi:hypothetical protein
MEIADIGPGIERHAAASLLAQRRYRPVYLHPSGLGVQRRRLATPSKHLPILDGVYVRFGSKAVIELTLGEGTWRLLGLRLMPSGWCDMAPFCLSLLSRMQHCSLSVINRHRWLRIGSASISAILFVIGQWLSLIIRLVWGF